MQVKTHSISLNRAPRVTLYLLMTTVVLVAYAKCPAQTLMGSPGAGWQTWTVTPLSFSQPDLNDNGSPWWDLQWAAAGSYGNSTGADKNPGFCITATGDCVGVGSAAFAPGTLPFWGMPYDSVNDTGGARDNKVFFRATGTLKATLYLNATANPNEVNEFGWFETDAGGTVVGKRHALFGGTGVNKDQIPTPVGTTAYFSPTRYFGFYYSDVSEPACPDGTDPYLTNVQCGDASLPLHGCYAYTLFDLNDAKCKDSGGFQGDHDFVIFKVSNSSTPVYWVAGEDPADCANKDGDCNLTMVKVTASERD
jgi:hypothetical protein